MENNERKDEIISVENLDTVEEEVQVEYKVKHPENPSFMNFLKALFDPTELAHNTGRIQWFLFPLLPAFSFALFALQLFFENVGTGAPAGNFLIFPIGALCGYALTLFGGLLLFATFKFIGQKNSFGVSVAVVSSCFVGAALIEILGLLINIITPISTSSNLGALGLFAFMVPLSLFTVKNGNGKILPTVLLTVVSLLNVVIVCLMLKVGGVA